MIHATSQGRKRKAPPYTGIEMCGLRQNEHGGGAVLLKVAPGARFPLHDHSGGEEVFVVYGRAAGGAVTVNTGDYLWTPPNGTHGIIE